MDQNQFSQNRVEHRTLSLKVIFVAMGFDPWYLENKLMRQSRFVGKQTLAKRTIKVCDDTNLGEEDTGLVMRTQTSR